VTVRPQGGLSTRHAWRVVAGFWASWSELMRTQGYSVETVALAARLCEAENYAERTRQVARRLAREMQSATLSDDLILSRN
jgi:hypothetical protein